MRRICAAWMTCAYLVMTPAIAWAQATITGIVRDESGAVLPGVTVEAASPALIERARLVVTDGTGQYRIVDLRPGTYSVTFTLTGFKPIRREGVELSGAFTATIDAELRVGAVEETITVSGEPAVVDVQSARRQQVVDRNLLAAIPTARTYQALVGLAPGVTTSGSQNVGGIEGPATRTFGVHGGPGTEGRVHVDGMPAGGARGGAGVSSYVVDVSNAQEVVYTTSGGLGEAETGGPIMNVVARTGGNTYTGAYFFGFSNGAMQGSNFTQELRDAGLRAPNEVIRIWDVSAALGGPFVRDRLWFYSAVRHQGNRAYIAGMYHNVNAGNPEAWTYEPDLSKRAIRDGTWKNASIRLTWQPTVRNRFNVFWDEQSICIECIGGGSPTRAPEAPDRTFEVDFLRVHSLTWTSPITNRLLAEAGYVQFRTKFGGEPDHPNMIPVTEQGGAIPGLAYRSTNWNRSLTDTPRWRASLSYVTGAHNAKFGYEGQYLYSDGTTLGNSQALLYRFNNGLPNQLTMLAHPLGTKQRTQGMALYAQNQWRRGRVSLQGAVRYERAWSFFPEQQIGPQRFIQDAIILPRTVGVSGFNDLSLRGGLAYDVFGDGKTSLRVSGGQYRDALQSGGIYIANNPLTRMVTETTRSWNDANRNFVPDCDLMNPALNGECGSWSNQNFGREVPGTRFDPALLQGWGVRPRDGQIGIGVQREIAPRVSTEVTYHRRWWGNFQVTDNIDVSPADFDSYSIVAPLDPRLPGGGGYVIDDLWEIRPDKFGRVDNFVTSTDNFGKRTEYWHGVDVNISARMLNGFMFQGGTSTGRRVTDECDVRPKIDEPSRRFCRVVAPFQTQFKGLTTYTIPAVDVQVSATIQSLPGPSLAANWVVPTAVVAATLGRPLSGARSNVTVNLVDPRTIFGDRINQIDFRVAKVVRFRGTRTQVGLDIFNLMNSNVPEGYLQTFGSAWLRPTSVMTARFMRISGQIDF